MTSRTVRGVVAGAAGTLLMVLPIAGIVAAPSASTISAPIALTGSGSTFDAPFFNLAFPAYHHLNEAVSIKYAAVGSSAGIQSFMADQVAFGASDVPMTSAEQATSQGGPSVQVPVDLGAEVVIYNLNGTGTGLHLTGPLIAEIFRGKITNWDSPAILALNPGVDIPTEPITVIHRSDGSGTTYIFSNYLSEVSSGWAADPGVGRSLNWPVGYGGDGNAGVAALVARIPGSIGYVERSYSSPRLFAYAAIRNAAGRFVTPTATNVAAAAAHKSDVSATNFSIVDQPGSRSYPIVGYSWVLVYQNQANTTSGMALVQLLDWVTHAGQVYAAQASYVPLPPVIRTLARSTLRQVVGPSGERLLSSS